MRTFAAYIFDLDGTLIDSLPGIEYSARQAVKEICPQRNLPSLRALIGPSVRTVFQQALAIDDAATLDLLVSAFRRSYDDDGWLRTQLYDGVDSTLRVLAKNHARLFVLTNKPAAATGRILRHLNSWNLFEQVIAPGASSASCHNKTEAARTLQASANLVPDATLLIGDSRDDALAAAACNFPFAAIQFGYGDAAVQTEAPVRFRFQRFSEILPTRDTEV